MVAHIHFQTLIHNSLLLLKLTISQHSLDLNSLLKVAQLLPEHEMIEGEGADPCGNLTEDLKMVTGLNVIRDFTADLSTKVTDYLVFHIQHE